ncbi:MAG: SMC-Scp complex subunit ScpB [Patescibacteria group bacterium]|nr:SMC-Scp complex subunit ScpB [Patescibacteria group bacterium]
MNTLAIKIQALLFALGRPLSRKNLAKMLGASASDIDEALATLQQAQSGIVLVDDGANLELRVAPEAAAEVERARKEEYSREIGKAGFEALAAILYRGSLSRSDIDFIRGVNSSQTLRTLTMRGLVRRTPNPKDERQYLYEPTTELLAQLGVTHPSHLPQFDDVRAKLKALEDAYRAKEVEQESHE